MKIISEKLSKFPGLVQGCNSNYLRYEYSDESKEAVQERAEYLQRFGIDPAEIVLSEQKHTNNVTIVSGSDKGKGFPKSSAIKNNDGLITAEGGVYLGVFTADCVPISLYDPVQKISGIAHSGWKGTVANIADQVVDRFQELGSLLEDIIAYIGPAIGACCYEVSQASDNRVKELLEIGGDQVVINKGQKIYIDLSQAVMMQLEQAGILPQNIEKSGICTCCDKYSLPSYYRNSSKRKIGSMLSIIGRSK